MTRLAYTYLFLWLLASPLMGTSDAILDLDARNLAFDGRKITLTGDVALRHPLGRLCAAKASVIQAPPGEGIPFSRIQLLKDVDVALNEGGRLQCDRADLNYTKQTGVLRGHAALSLPFHPISGADIPVDLKGDTINFDLLPYKGTPNHLISNLVAQGHVEIHYGRSLQAFADRAIYRQTNESVVRKTDLSGSLFLLPQNKGGTCEICRGDKDRIQAQLIRIDSDEHTLFFQEPKGTLSFATAQGILKNVRFQAKEMTWNESRALLVLKGDVQVKDPLLGDLYADDSLEMILEETFDGSSLRSLRTEGPTYLVLQDPSCQQPRQISCHEGMEIDNRRLEITFKRSGPPSEGKGRQQVCYQDATGQIHSDRATIRYRSNGSQWAVQDLLIEGNVFLVNWGVKQEDASSKTLQYAKADSLKILPDKGQMLLSGKSHRVLFFDKVNNVQVSAPAVEMSRDAKTGKDAVRGLGDVRLQLIGEELDDILEEAREVVEFTPRSSIPAA